MVVGENATLEVDDYVTDRDGRCGKLFASRVVNTFRGQLIDVGSFDYCKLVDGGTVVVKGYKALPGTNGYLLRYRTYFQRVHNVFI